MSALIEKTLSDIEPASKKLRLEAQTYLDGLVKPIGSLGKLEQIAAQIASITGKVQGNDLDKRCVVVMCADNGICEEGVSGAPQEVTVLMAKAMAAGTSGMTVLARESNSDVVLVDVGIRSKDPIPGLLDRRIANGTANFAAGPAMSRADCERAIEVGIEVTGKLIDEGYRLIGTGELGMGNTSSSAAVLSALAGVPVEDVTGKGAGLTEEDYRHKKEVLRKALAMHAPRTDDPADVVAKVGGLDIAALTGVYLCAAARKVPVVIDGLISAVAALVACRMSPATADYMIASHASTEPGYAIAMRELHKEPMLALDMRLGEGSGCPIAFHVIDAALAVINNMATFAEASVDGGELVDIRA